MSSELTWALAIRPRPTRMPEHSVRLRMPKRSCSLPANSVAKARKKLVMEKVVATSASPQWNLSTSGWLNRLQV
ncbi:Uncharacterised protein [Acinetobacter baumannii]|nr:Uncharacterised protein [Acinetobacter baumannii]